MENLKQYILYVVTFICSEAASMWGQYYTLKYPDMGMIEAFMRAIPFAWVDWFFMTIAIDLGNKYKLVTPTQDIFMLIIVQFTAVLIINHYWLKQLLTRSDIVTYVLILVAFYVSFTKVITKYLKSRADKKQTRVAESAEAKGEGGGAAPGQQARRGTDEGADKGAH